MSVELTVTKKELGGELTRFVSLGIFNVGVMLFLFTVLRSIQPEIYPALDVALSWVIAYLATSLMAHHLHRKYTFATDGVYKRSLYRAMIVYSVVMVISTAAIYIAVDIFGYDDFLMAVILNPITGLLNFIGLRFLAFEIPIIDRS
jgi:putative flippase GtrA